MRATPFFLGAVAGAAAAYFLDPEGGKRRRSIATDKAGKYARKGGAEATRQADYAAGVAKGKVVEAASSVTPSGESELNDPALARKVESEIFRDAGAPKGQVNVNAENGVIVLRGKVEDEETAERLATQAGEVEGVERVDSLLDVAARN
jgi:osmotically-inducible protein OsmY